MFKCEKCKKEYDKIFGSGRFCSRSCANSRIYEEDKKKNIYKKVSNSLKKDGDLSFCEYCSKPFFKKRKRKYYCSVDCSARDLVRKIPREVLVKAGLKSSQMQMENRRSKNEVFFADLCKNHFDNVRTNDPIFNGWDADVIINDYKIAVLWNGAWHYKQISRTRLLASIQNRDNIKVEEIMKKKYTPYIIKDMGKFNKKFVKNEFDKFLLFLSTF